MTYTVVDEWKLASAPRKVTITVTSAPGQPALTADKTAPRLELLARSPLRSRSALRRGIRLTATASEAGRLVIEALVDRKTARSLGIDRRVGSLARNLAAGKTTLKLRLYRKVRGALADLERVKPAPRRQDGRRGRQRPHPTVADQAREEVKSGAPPRAVRRRVRALAPFPEVASEQCGKDGAMPTGRWDSSASCSTTCASRGTIGSVEVTATATLWCMFSCFLLFPKMGFPPLMHRTAMTLLVAELVALAMWSYGSEGCVERPCGEGAELGRTAAAVDVPLLALALVALAMIRGMRTMRRRQRVAR